MLNPRRVIAALKQNIGKVIVGKDEVIELALIAMLCKGHVLIEDVPGTGKTTMVSALAKSLSCSFNRIQFTPDVVPSDVTGFTMINMKSGDMEFHPGAVMCQIVLADEINRTSPKTQSSLLEIMEEFQVTVDGVTHPLPQPFMVLATQNPGEFVGTYPLPEAQMDRFALQFSLGYVSQEQEVAVLSAQQHAHPIESVNSCVTLEDMMRLREAAQNVRMSEELKHYVVKLAAATRTAPGVQLGASPRASIALMKVAQALALFDGEEFVSPEHINELAVPVLAHRILLEPQAKFAGVSAQSVVQEVLKRVPVPA
jgi:MoxR-like ATPase